MSVVSTPTVLQGASQVAITKQNFGIVIDNAKPQSLISIFNAPHSSFTNINSLDLTLRNQITSALLTSFDLNISQKNDIYIIHNYIERSKKPTKAAKKLLDKIQKINKLKNVSTEVKVGLLNIVLNEAQQELNTTDRILATVTNVGEYALKIAVSSIK